MKRITLEKICLVAALALGPVLAVSAQSIQSSAAPYPTAAPPAPAVAQGNGLLGSDYAEVDFGYDKEHGVPDLIHDYGFVYNQSVFRDGAWGTDANLGYDYLTGAAYGYHDYRDRAEAGLTEYFSSSWGSPFVTADAGGAWQRTRNVSRKSFAYDLTAGVEIPLAYNLFLTPFTEYQAEPHLYNHEIPLAFDPNHVWDYGVKATYRFTKTWSLSFGATLDQYSRNDLGYKAGLTCHF